MSSSFPEEEFRAVLTGEHPGLVRNRPFFLRLPSPPRCKLCAAPFAGPGGAILRHAGFARFEGNPALCRNCLKTFEKWGVGGAEIPVSLLFADIRGSTGLGERLSPIDLSRLLDGFYRVASAAILDHDGIVDKLVGDEIIGLFIGGTAGPRHTAAAIEAGRALLRAVGRTDASPLGPIPVGAAVHTGIAFVGTVGAAGAATDFTALGDPVNTTARLASLAAAGQLLVSRTSAESAAIDTVGLEHRTLEIRGRTESVDVFVLT